MAVVAVDDVLHGRRLADLLAARGDFSEAAHVLQRLIVAHPTEHSLILKLADVLTVSGNLQLAIDLLTPLCKRYPEDVNVAYALGLALSRNNRLHEAGSVLECAQADGIKRPNYLKLMAKVCYMLGQLSPALRCLERLVLLEPNYYSHWHDLSAALHRDGQIMASLSAARRALDLKPDAADVYSHFCWLTLNIPGWSRKEAHIIHSAWGALMAARFNPCKISPLPLPQGQSTRRLRLGYVSADFREHPIAIFLEPILAHHDHNAFEIFLFSDVGRMFGEDRVSQRLKSYVSNWFDVAGDTDEQLTQRIREAEIDILVDLAGHSSYNRLNVFAMRAAPVQITWLGYANTTGLATMDYRITDAVTDPAPEADIYHSERLIRLPGGFLCYRPYFAGPPAPPPCLKSLKVTFGSFNNSAKLGEPVITLWSRLLASIPDAQLLLKSRQFCDEGVVGRLKKRFTDHGIEIERIICREADFLLDAHFTSYQDIDIALDPFPYNGTTTSFDALWMGVPVLTLVGDRHAARVTMAILRALDLEELVAADEDAFVNIAINLAADPQRLAWLRSVIRPRLEASPYRDEAGFTKKLENALSVLWQEVFNDSQLIRGSFT